MEFTKINQQGATEFVKLQNPAMEKICALILRVGIFSSEVYFEKILALLILQINVSKKFVACLLIFGKFSLNMDRNIF